MEVDFDTYVIQAARYCGTNYRCNFGGGNCGAIFHTEYEMVEHLGRAESEGGHETEMRNRYNNLDEFFASARPQAIAYNEEDPIARSISEEVASKISAGNSEGEGDDPLRISSAEKRKGIDMELMCLTCKRSLYHKNVVEESTVVAYDMKEHVPIAEEKEEDDVPKVPEPSKGLLEEHVPMKEKKDVLHMLRKEELEKLVCFYSVAVASKFCAGNSEGEGDDPLCVSFFFWISRVYPLLKRLRVEI